MRQSFAEEGHNHVSPMAMITHYGDVLKRYTERRLPEDRPENQKRGIVKPKNEAPKPSISDKGKKEVKSEKKSTFKFYNFIDAINHGVKPETLIDHGGTSAKAVKLDPPTHTKTPLTVLTAYLEPLNLEEWEIKPLPSRKMAKQSNLKIRKFSRVDSCSKLTQQWPVDDTPTDQDTFLPWIHDVFPSDDGKFIQFVAQNKRRCKTGKKILNETDILEKMQPQAALFQHVPIQRIRNLEERETRYRLSSHKEADPDGLATRFICRFKPGLQETLSVFNFDYDWISLRKGFKNGTFEKDKGGIKSIHTSQLVFKCPVPDSLQESIRTGVTIQNDWATLFVDLIPIRTPPRYGPSEQFFQPRYEQFQFKNSSLLFDPATEWGNSHILPKIQDSGRWENIPICLPSYMQYEQRKTKEGNVAPLAQKKKHRLASCIWASAGYNTRGNRFAVNDGQRRLLEWISYNKVIGFDHFYLYDNSGAYDNNNETSLKPIADLFPDLVTYIPWPSQVCNNRPANVDSPGERSSQYAAEASCLLRFGPHVEWFGHFDVDEYLVPMGQHPNVTVLLGELEKKDTRIASMKSWRAWPRRALIDGIHEIMDQEICWSNEACFPLSIPNNVTLLQAYNCDRALPGHKTKVMPAEKQLYRPDYVTMHFVHYSIVTKLSEKNKQEWLKDEKFHWNLRSFPDPRQRFLNEETEALMLHAKAVAIQDTAGYKRMCSVENLKLPIRRQGLCRLGVPWPKEPLGMLGTPEGHAYNCYVNDQIEHWLVPQLEKELKKHALVLAQ